MEDAEVPETPAIEKYVNQAVHKDITLDEVFTYDIIAYITKDADSALITDELIDVLEFAGDAKTVTVVDLGTENNYKVTNNIANVKVNDDATVAVKGTSIASLVTMDGKKLAVDIEDATSVRGHFVKVTFSAKIAAGKTLADVQGAYTGIDVNDPVVSDEAHTGLPNTASYTVFVGGEAKYALSSNTVTVKPSEKPEAPKKPFVPTGDATAPVVFVSGIVALLAGVALVRARRRA